MESRNVFLGLDVLACVLISDMPDGWHVVQFLVECDFLLGLAGRMRKGCTSIVEAGITRLVLLDIES